MLFYQFYFFQTFRNGNIIDQKMVQWWKEGSQEEELVIPSSWIEGNYVRWPNSSSAAAALK